MLMFEVSNVNIRQRDERCTLFHWIRAAYHYAMQSNKMNSKHSLIILHDFQSQIIRSWIEFTLLAEVV